MMLGASSVALSVSFNNQSNGAAAAGVWGAIIERWLDHLLPDDAAERCRGRVEVVVTQLPFGNQITISDFKDKRDLIDVCMASSHVPLLLDWKVARTCR